MNIMRFNAREKETKHFSILNAGELLFPLKRKMDVAPEFESRPPHFFFLSLFSVFLRFFIVYGLFWNSFCTHTEKNVRLACHESLKPLSRFVTQ